jgi:hypothetical protein
MAEHAIRGIAVARDHLGVASPLHTDANRYGARWAIQSGDPEMTLSLRSSLHGLLVCIAAGAAIHVTACSSSSSSPPGLTSGCQPSGTVACSSADTAYACAPGATPGLLACDPGTTDGSGNTDFCCFAGDTSSGCAPDDSLTSTACITGETGYQCNDGLSPVSGNPSLSCNEGTPDPDGAHINFCCGPKTVVEDAGGDGAAPTEDGASPTEDGGTPTGDAAAAGD